MNNQKTNWWTLMLLILAGESVFILPFVLARVFRPTVLDAFQINNLELGYCFSAYGIVALISYLIGGPIADRYSPRKLIAIALWMTSLGGLVYGTFPDYPSLKLLYGYWGFTTIFLFWAPMIKATRIWGGLQSQGKAFGFLDGGRGMVGALFGVLGVFIFSIFINASSNTQDVANSREAFKYVIEASSVLVAIVGVMVWVYLDVAEEDKNNSSLKSISKSQIFEVLRLPSIWLLMIIILCAYVGYKITDVFSLYAKEVMHFDEINSAKVGTLLLFVRPIIGVAFGFLADRTKITFWLLISFFITCFGSLLFISGWLLPSFEIMFLVSTFIVATGVYAARALYFAVMQKGRIPITLTGTAVGLISIVGYTPDIFAGPLMGYLLDNSPGITGHQHVFYMLASFSLVGGLAAIVYHRKYGVYKSS